MANGVQSFAVAGNKKLLTGIDQRLNVEDPETPVLSFSFQDGASFPRNQPLTGSRWGNGVIRITRFR
jgi:hypothetical protein